MQAALNKIKSDKFNTLVHLNDIIGVFNKDVKTNLTRNEEIALATQFAHMPKSGLHSDTAGMPYVDTKILADGGEVLIPDNAKKQHQVETMLLNPPVPTPSPAPGQVAAIDPKSVRVDVENGSGVPGAARRIADQLRKEGFAIGEIGNAQSSDMSTTELFEHSKITFAGLKVRQALGKAGQSARVIDGSGTPSPAASPAKASDVTVVVGQDLATALAAQLSDKP